MRFKTLLIKIYEQSGSGIAKNILSNIENLRNIGRRGSPNAEKYKRAISRPPFPFK